MNINFEPSASFDDTVSYVPNRLCGRFRGHKSITDTEWTLHVEPGYEDNDADIVSEIETQLQKIHDMEYWADVVNIANHSTGSYSVDVFDFIHKFTGKSVEFIMKISFDGENVDYLLYCCLKSRCDGCAYGGGNSKCRECGENKDKCALCGNNQFDGCVCLTYEGDPMCPYYKTERAETAE